MSAFVMRRDGIIRGCYSFLGSEFDDRVIHVEMNMQQHIKHYEDLILGIKIQDHVAKPKALGLADMKDFQATFKLHN